MREYQSLKEIRGSERVIRDMAKLHSCSCTFALTTLLTFLVLPSLQTQISRRLLPPLQLHLQAPPSFLRNASCNNNMQQPLIPYLFSDQRLSYFDESSQVHVNVGSANGLYLADPAASMEVRYVFFTATLGKGEGRGVISRKGVGEGSLVMMGSVGSGAISVVGGTGDFAFASGQAKVSMAAAGGESGEISVLLDVELQLEEDDTAVE